MSPTTATSITWRSSSFFDPKPLYTVSTATPARSAMAATVVPVHPVSSKHADAAASTCARVRSACAARSGEE